MQGDPGRPSRTLSSGRSRGLSAPETPEPRVGWSWAELRKGAERGAQGVWEGSDGTTNGHPLGRRDPLARRSPRTTTWSQ